MSAARQPLRVLLAPHLADASGAPRTAARIARGLDPARFNVLTVFPCEGELPALFRREGLPCETLSLVARSLRSMDSWSARAAWLNSRLDYFRGMMRLIGRFRPDAVYIHSSVQLLGGLAARARGVPVAWHIHEMFNLETAGGRRARAIRRGAITRMARTVIFCGWAARRAFGRRPRGQAWFTIPNAADIFPFDREAIRREVRREFALPENAPLLLAVGAIQPAKGFDVLIEALVKLRREGMGSPPPPSPLSPLSALSHPSIQSTQPPPSHLWIAGPQVRDFEDYSRALKEKIAEAGLGERVRFLGRREDVPRLMAAADIFVLPSRAEAFPLTLLEAMAAATPFIASDVGDCALLAGKGLRGLAAAPGSPSALAAALAQLLGAPPSARAAMGEAGRRFAERHFSERQFLESISAALERTALSPGGRGASRKIFLLS